MSDRTGERTSGSIGTGGNVNETPAGSGAQARQAGSQVLAHASAVAQDAKERSGALVGDMKDRAVTAAEEGKEGLADQMDEVAQAVHRAGEQFEGHQDWIAGVVERGATELGALASTLRTNDLQSLLGNLGDLSRRQPAVFLGAAMAAGFAAVRLGKVATAGISRTDLPKMPGVDREHH